MKKTFFIVLMFLCMFVLSGCPPKVKEEIGLIENNKFGNVYINFITVYQENEDYIVLNIEHKNSLKNFYITGNSLDILGGVAFGYELERKSIDGREFFYVDLNEFDVGKNDSFYLILSLPKNSVYENIYYEEIVDSEIVAHSFDICLNYDNNKNNKIENYKFFIYARSDSEEGRYDQNGKIIIYNNIDDFLDNNGFYEYIYLPHINCEMASLSKEIIYYPNYEHTLFLSSDNFTLRVWESNTGIVYGNQQKQYYEYNGINYTIILQEAERGFNIDFVIDECIQYHYNVFNNNIDFDLTFIHSLQKYS